jgi:hypothetical protein
MADDPDPQLARATTPARILLCGTCRGVRICSPTDLLGYTKAGWPRCCGEVMTLFTRGGLASDDTKVDRPPLPPT